jgi:hypothetical protein
MQPDLEQLWQNAIAKSNETGVPAVALVRGYQAVISGEAMLTDVGQQLVSEFGASQLLDNHTLAQRDQAIGQLADKLGISHEEARAIFDTVLERVSHGAGD